MSVHREQIMDRLGLWCDDFFNNSLVISSHSVLLMEETKVSAENHRLVASNRKMLSHEVALSTPRHLPDSN